MLSFGHDSYQKGMPMTGMGKIARSPRGMREELRQTLKACPLHGREGRPFRDQFPGFNLDGLRKAAGMPPQELGPGPEAKARVARPHPNPLPQERELTSAGLGMTRGLAEASMRANQAQSGQIKPNQTESNLWGDGSGQWTVDSGQWLVAKGGGGRLSGQTESNPVKPEGLAVCRT